MRKEMFKKHQFGEHGSQLNFYSLMRSVCNIFLPLLFFFLNKIYNRINLYNL